MTAPLRAFELDLEGYPAMLIEEDISHNKSMKSLDTARNQLTRATRVSGILVLVSDPYRLIERGTVDLEEPPQKQRLDSG